MNAQQHKAFRKIFNTSMASGTPVGQSVAMAMERSKRAVKPIFRPHNRLYLGQRESLPKLNDFKVGDIGFFENFHISTYSFLRNDIVEFILQYYIMKDCSQDESTINLLNYIDKHEVEKATAYEYYVPDNSISVSLKPIGLEVPYSIYSIAELFKTKTVYKNIDDLPVSMHRFRNTYKPNEYRINCIKYTPKKYYHFHNACLKSNAVALHNHSGGGIFHVLSFRFTCNKSDLYITDRN